MLDSSTVFVSPGTASDYEVRVNFGMLAGREATRAELDDLIRELVPLLGSVAVVAERRQEADDHAEVELHQVRIDLAADDPLEDVVVIAERWAQACFESRHAEVSEP
ncbi:MAG: hypothetical protein ICV67_00020 [Thermoleophilia bacterium]|nr:hypothetical protein [Thermoleophilia bacterium]